MKIATAGYNRVVSSHLSIHRTTEMIKVALTIQQNPFAKISNMFQVYDPNKEYYNE